MHRCVCAKDESAVVPNHDGTHPGQFPARGVLPPLTPSKSKRDDTLP